MSDTITVRATLEGLSPYSSGRHHNTPFKTDSGGVVTESYDAYERRNWRMKVHFDKETKEVLIPCMALRHAIVDASAHSGDKIPGMRGKMWKSLFERGVYCFHSPGLGIKVDDLQFDELFLPSDGVRGSGKRVPKIFPIVPPGWKANVEYLVVDGRITKEAFEKYLNLAGVLIGLGFFRPERRGYYGRFKVTDFAWDAAAA